MREILYCGDPVLRKKAKRVREVTDELLDLLEDMKQTMLEAPGVGLAAPQVGESVRAIVVRADIDDEAAVMALLNPRIVERDGEAEGIEGCLSLPTLQGLVVRASEVVAEGTTPEGDTVSIEAEGLLARALQHEIDHLQGVLFLDRAEEDTLGWMVPDEDEENGYRVDSASVEQIVKRFDRLRAEREQE